MHHCTCVGDITKKKWPKNSELKKGSLGHMQLTRKADVQNISKFGVGALRVPTTQRTSRNPK